MIGFFCHNRDLTKDENSYRDGAFHVAIGNWLKIGFFLSRQSFGLTQRASVAIKKSYVTTELATIGNFRVIARLGMRSPTHAVACTAGSQRVRQEDLGCS